MPKVLPKPKKTDVCPDCKKDINRKKCKGKFLVKGKWVCNDCYLK